MVVFILVAVKVSFANVKSWSSANLPSEFPAYTTRPLVNPDDWTFVPVIVPLELIFPEAVIWPAERLYLGML